MTKRKGMRKYLRGQWFRTFLKWERKWPPNSKKPRESQIGKHPRQNTPRHILIKLMKIKHKEQILKAAREKQQMTHKRILIRITADLLIETLQASREWQDILKVMKQKNLQPRLLHPARISFKYEGEIKSFTDKQTLREFSTTKPALQQMLKDLLYTGNTKGMYKLKPQTIK